ncbi:MAG TPA: hypothetical protein VFC63_22990 [Blastocatellia bacterium]|nr:hypothetical protein [Blastocatellia bacterium]
MCTSLYRNYSKTFWLLLVFGVLATTANAQIGGTPTPPKAPPIDFSTAIDSNGLPKILNQIDKDRILQEHNEKDRTRLYMALMDQYRDLTRKQVGQDQFADAINSLCAYAAIANHAVRFLSTEVPLKKSESSLKKLEMALRSDLLYFEPMLRDFNFYNAENATALVEKIKEARVDALNASFGGEILHKPGEKP